MRGRYSSQLLTAKRTNHERVRELVEKARLVGVDTLPTFIQEVMQSIIGKADVFHHKFSFL